MSKGPYTSAPPEWYQEAMRQQQLQMLRRNGYMMPYLVVNNPIPDVYIMGRRYNGNTGEMIK